MDEDEDLDSERVEVVICGVFSVEWFGDCVAEDDGFVDVVEEEVELWVLRTSMRCMVEGE